MAPRYLLVLAALLITLALFVDMTESQRNSGRSGRRRNSSRRRGNRNGRRGGRRGSRRGNQSADGDSTEGCEEIILPMCRGLLSYQHTKLPNSFNHTTQAEVYQDLEHMWAYMDHPCSVNTRRMLCALYLPKCRGRSRAEGPCRTTCMRAKRKCSDDFQEMFGIQWTEQFSCRGLPRRGCLGPLTETQCTREYPDCIDISSIPVCSGLSFTYGTVPNMFYQCRIEEITTELEYYTPLRESNCHPNLNFLLCGVYTPFCIRAEVPFTFPCREICDQVREACEDDYARLYHNLPWPNKLQCHRYPSSESPGGHRCVMPNEGSTFSGGK